MFDIRPFGSGLFGVGEKNQKLIEENQSNHENFLVEALREQETIELLKTEKQKRARKNKELQIKKEAKSFKNVNLGHSFLGKEVPARIVSAKLNKEYLEEKRQEKIREQIYLEQQQEKQLIREKERQQGLREKEVLQLEEEAFRRIQAENQKKVEIKKRIQVQKELESRAMMGREAETEKKLNLQKIKELKNTKRLERKKSRELKLKQIKQNLLAKPISLGGQFSFLKPALAFSGSCFAIFLIIFSSRFFFYGMQIKDQVVVKGVSVVADLDQVKNNFQDKNFSQIVLDFQKIQSEIDVINQDLEKMEGGLPDVISRIPFISKYGSAKKVLEAGGEIATAMVLVSQSIEDFSKIENPLNFENKESSSLGDFFLELEKKLVLAEKHFQLAQDSLEKVDPNDLSEEYREKIVILKENFPKGLALLIEFNQKQIIFKDLLGYNGPRKYLFLFQNNHELRATGGFIGSYGVLGIHNGNVKELFIDGIFNPDGQLSAKVVPPRPIQKISTNWSTHDANWFPDFPTSAEKIAWFYEKTGGPTVDGIITLTPTVMEKLLEITGPIEMVEYGVTVNSENFIEATQFEVEEDYDKEENKPKKFIADLTPKILDKVFSKENLNDFPKSLKILSEALNEKHILIYSENSEIQKTISSLGWSGEILNTPRDYLMVVNSNVNGYKTDGVIDQEIKHQVEIEEDGSIIDTVTIERFHNGGSSEYEWWNKVNANYMRVYVPKGSELIEADGYTRETVETPVDYDKLGFERDSLVVDLEESVEIDEESGTEIWEEQDKTVFANWVYVSPQESVKVSYKYKLPFKLDLNSEQGKMDTYSVLYQKQSGMNTSGLKTELKIAENQNVFWQYPDELEDKNNFLEYNSNLEKDQFLGVVLK